MKISTKLQGLQSLRALAAFSVLLQHVTYYSCLSAGIDYQTYLRIDFGRLGVQIFFVISGFVMAGCMYQGRMFLLNRILRVYPGYWLAIALSYLLLINPIFGWMSDWRSFLLIPAQLNNSYRIPYWTLIYEIAFYIFTYLIILSGANIKAVTRICIVWLLLIICVTKYVNIPQFEPGNWILLSRLNVYFILGMLLGMHVKEIEFKNPLPLALGGVSLWCIGDALAGATPLSSDLLLGFSFCLLVFGMRYVKISALEWLGDTSYGIYLLHVPIATITINFLTKNYINIGFFKLWALTMMVTIIGSVLFGRAEHLFHQRIKHFVQKIIFYISHGNIKNSGA